MQTHHFLFSLGIRLTMNSTGNIQDSGTKQGNCIKSNVWMDSLCYKYQLHKLSTNAFKKWIKVMIYNSIFYWDVLEVEQIWVILEAIFSLISSLDVFTDPPFFFLIKERFKTLMNSIRAISVTPCEWKAGKTQLLIDFIFRSILEKKE